MIVRYSPVDNSVIFYLTALCDTDNEADYFEFYNTTRELAKLTVNLCYLSDAYKLVWKSKSFPGSREIWQMILSEP